MESKDVLKTSCSAKAKTPASASEMPLNGVNASGNLSTMVVVTRVPVPGHFASMSPRTSVAGMSSASLGLPGFYPDPRARGAMTTVDRSQASALGLKLEPSSPFPVGPPPLTLFPTHHPQVTLLPAMRPLYATPRHPTPILNIPKLVHNHAPPLANPGVAKPSAPAGQAKPPPADAKTLSRPASVTPSSGRATPSDATGSASPRAGTRSPARSPGSPPSARIRLMDLNPHLLCVLCGGYLVDATTIIECLHSFCRTCIYRYLESSKYCPICDVQVHKTKPLINCRTDNTLQTLVYKLVPGLFKEEMRRRREYYAANPGSGPPASSASSPNAKPEGKVTKETCTPPRKPEQEKEKISVCLQHISRPPNPKSKRPFPVARADRCDVRFLLCPPDVPVSHLKKFLRLKFDLGDKYKIDLYYSGDMSLKDRVTLEGVALIYAWKKESPLKLYWVVQDLTVPLPAVLTAAVKHRTPSKAPKRRPEEARGKESAKKRRVEKENAKQQQKGAGKGRKPGEEEAAAGGKRAGRKRAAKRKALRLPGKKNKVGPAGRAISTPVLVRDSRGKFVSNKGALAAAAASPAVKVPPVKAPAAQAPPLKAPPVREAPPEYRVPPERAGEKSVDIGKLSALNNNVAGSVLGQPPPPPEPDSVDSGISDSQADSDRSTDGGDAQPAEPRPEETGKDSGAPPGSPAAPGIVRTATGNSVNKDNASSASNAKTVAPAKTPVATQLQKSNSSARSTSKKTPKPSKKVTCRSGVRKRVSPAQQIRLKKLKQQSPPGVRRNKTPLGVKLGAKKAAAAAGGGRSLKQAVSHHLGKLRRAVTGKKGDGGKGEGGKGEGGQKA